MRCAEYSSRSTRLHVACIIAIATTLTSNFTVNRNHVINRNFTRFFKYHVDGDDKLLVKFAWPYLW